mmetsp:Transcript_21133/g.29052  ORF Transcript_21133/g.29052 Transcript_21133/m.29052 type:complete len:352 (+) Transcript_21133:870-1925(+)
MSAKEVEMMAWMPWSLIAQGACSRLEPQPKLSPATSTFAWVQGSLFRTKSPLLMATSGPSLATSSAFSYRSSAKAAKPRPARLIVFRYSLGMIMSVSMFWMSSAAATPLTVVKASPPASSESEPPALLALICAPREGRGAGCSRVSGAGGACPAVPSGGSSRTSVSLPVTAAAAAMAGDIRCVRPPLPCRPSKLRLLVEAQRSCGLSLSGFMARHMEQPGSRQSKPAANSTLSSPSASACSLTSPEPGTTIACTPAGTRRPSATLTTSRMSSMRPLVQLPMNTFSTGTSASTWPGCRPMYSKERRMPAARSGLGAASGSGTMPVMGAVSCGEVPQVTVGAMSAALILTTVS